MSQIVVLPAQAVSPVQGAPEYVIHTGDGDGLSPRGRLLATVLAIALLLIGVLACAWAGAAPITGARTATPTTAGTLPTEVATASVQPAANSPATPAAGSTPTAPGDSATTTVADAIKAVWDGPTVHLDWTGKTYTTAEATFVGDRIASPGDHVQRTLNIANAGPADAVMTVSLVLAEQTPALAANAELAKGINLIWDVGGVTGNETYADLLARQAGQPVVAEVQVPQGKTVAVTVGFEMPLAITDYRSLESPSDLLTFNVLARMQGNTAAPGVIPNLPIPAPPGGTLAVTGATVFGVVAVAVGLFLVGWLLIAATRRRRQCCEHCGEPVRGGRGEPHGPSAPQARA